jgi:nitronate monooxygenase
VLLHELALPLVLAPMAGGPSTPALTAAVSGTGGLGFLAAGYLSAAALEEQLGAVRSLTDAPFGVNLFCPPGAPPDPAAVGAYVDRVLTALAASAGVALGAPRHDDDGYDAKLDVLLAGRPGAVSFTFGCPTGTAVERLHDAGIEAWVTVTDAEEAAIAAAVGADVLVAQGAEAGGHRGSFVDHDRQPLPLDALLAELASRHSPTPIVATGGLMDGDDVARVLASGAAAAQLGTAFLCCPEAGTVPVHREALRSARPTVLTRAFTGRRARGIANAWSEAAGDTAPSAYPEIHHVTSALRAHGRATGQPDLVNLWAGTAHERVRSLPAAELVAAIAGELADARRR